MARDQQIDGQSIIDALKTLEAAINECKNFIDAVRWMRAAQREYSKRKTKILRDRCHGYEERVDAMLAKLIGIKGT